MSTYDNAGPESEWVVPPEPAGAPPAAPGGGAGRSRFDAVARAVAPVLAGLLVGGGVMFAVEHRSGSSASVASGGNVPGAFGARSGDRGTFGGVAGEVRLQGTVTATTSTSITVRSSSGGTATYTVAATSQIVRNGQAASLSDVKVGDPVFLHVIPSSSGQKVVERLFAGTSASGGDGFGPPPGRGTRSVPGVSIS